MVSVKRGTSRYGCLRRQRFNRLIGTVLGVTQTGGQRLGQSLLAGKQVWRALG
jgi:hypothetical protein